MTSIEWTDRTINFATGCSRVSPGCDHCYMMAMYPRLRGMGVPGYGAGPETVSIVPERIEEMRRLRGPSKVFVNSMSDTFHKAIPFNVVDRLWCAMFDNPKVVFQVLTKRPGRIPAWWAYHNEFSWRVGCPMGRNHHDGAEHWPDNIWLGTSVETQKYAPRLDVLGRVPASVQFVSAEPMLGPLDLRRWLAQGFDASDGRGGRVRICSHCCHGDRCDEPSHYRRSECPWCKGKGTLPDRRLSWVIIGGESGQRARPLDIAWVRDLIEQCTTAGVPVFVKQLGSVWSRQNEARDPKGGDPDEWPVDLRWRQFPLREHPAVARTPDLTP